MFQFEISNSFKYLIPNNFFVPPLLPSSPPGFFVMWPKCYLDDCFSPEMFPEQLLEDIELFSHHRSQPGRVSFEQKEESVDFSEFLYGFSNLSSEEASSVICVLKARSVDDGDTLPSRISQPLAHSPDRLVRVTHHAVTHSELSAFTFLQV